MVFHGSSWVLMFFSWFHGFVWFFMVPGWFSMVRGVYMVFHGSRSVFMVLGGFSWFFHVSRLVFHFSHWEHPKTVFWPDGPVWALPAISRLWPSTVKKNSDTKLLSFLFQTQTDAKRAMNVCWEKLYFAFQFNAPFLLSGQLLIKVLYLPYCCLCA